MTSRPAVVIRCRNEAEWIGRVLDRVLAQSPAPEVVVIDSGSTDGTIAAVQSRPVRLLHIPAAEFTFGRALNRAVAAIDAPLVVALSAHALPVDHRWLALLLAPFDDPRVAATYGRQLPHPGLDPFRAKQVLEYWRAEPREDTAGDIRYSNTNGAFRRSAWEAHGFDEAMPYSEDDEWSAWAVAQGQRVVYVPEAEVFHSHDEGLVRWYRRQRAQAAADGQPREPLPASLRRFLRLTSSDLRAVAADPRQWRWIPLAPALRAAEVMGIRAGRAGR